MIRSKNKHTIRFVDSTPNAGNKGALIIDDAHGNTIVMTNTHIDDQVARRAHHRRAEP